MTEDTTIAEAAEKALRDIGRASTLEEIYARILALGLYRFNTPTPQHVLYTTLQRHTAGTNRSDPSPTVLFQMDPEKLTYQPVETAKPAGAKRSGGFGLKRILRSSDKDEIIRSLMDEKIGLFREIWRLLLFSAQVGLLQGKREPLKSIDTGKGIDQQTFGNSPAWPGVLHLLSLVESEDPTVLGATSEAEERRIQAFQEYANGGLSVLRDFFRDRSSDLEGMLAFIETHLAEPARLPPADTELSI